MRFLFVLPFLVLPTVVGAGLLAASNQPAKLVQIAFHDLGGGGLHADVWLHRRIAYVGTEAPRSSRTPACPGTGVKIVDLEDPAHPRLLGHLAQHPGTTTEVIRVRSIETPAFRGDLLAVGLQQCSSGGRRGLDLWDVTDPRAPVALGFFPVATTPEDPVGGVHELDLVQRGDGRVVALLAVPYSERDGQESPGDLRIVDVSDPRNPVGIADWGIRRDLGLGRELELGRSIPAVYAHSARASADGLRAYVSYWDAGVVILDLAEPAAPRFVGRTSFAPDDEGDAHSVDLADGERILVEADETLDVESPGLYVDARPGFVGIVPAAGTLPGFPWTEVSTVSAELAYVGRGCPAGRWDGVANTTPLDQPDPYLSDPRGRIALIDRGACPFVAKVERVHAMGAVGAIIINSGAGLFAPYGDRGPLGAFMISRDDGARLISELEQGRTATASLGGDLHVYTDFGGLRFWDIRAPDRPRQLATFRTPRSLVDRDRGPAWGGRFSAHNPVVVGDLLFVSWFADGVRVLDIADPTRPREIAAWLPPDGNGSEPSRTDYARGPAVWGVATDGDIVVASDINSGLFVLRLVYDPGTGNGRSRFTD